MYITFNFKSVFINFINISAILKYLLLDLAKHDDVCYLIVMNFPYKVIVNINI